MASQTPREEQIEGCGSISGEEWDRMLLEEFDKLPQEERHRWLSHPKDI